MKTLFAALFICSFFLIDALATGLAIDPTGNLFFLGANPATIFKFSPDGAVTTFAKAKEGEDWEHIATDRNGNVFATTTATRKDDTVVTALVKFAPNGKHATFVAEVAKGQPTGLGIDRNGNLFVGISSLDKFHPGDSIVRMAPNGRQKTVFAKDLATPSHFAFDSSGNLFVYDEGTDAILKFTADRKQSTLDKGITVYDLACDQAGNLFVALPHSKKIEKIGPDGTKTTFAKDVAPWFLAVDKAGNIFVLDNGIIRISPDGNRTLFAKNPVEQPK